MMQIVRNKNGGILGDLVWEGEDIVVYRAALNCKERSIDKNVVTLEEKPFRFDVGDLVIFSEDLCIVHSRARLKEVDRYDLWKLTRHGKDYVGWTNSNILQKPTKHLLEKSIKEIFS